MGENSIDKKASKEGKYNDFRKNNYFCSPFMANIFYFIYTIFE